MKLRRQCVEFVFTIVLIALGLTAPTAPAHAKEGRSIEMSESVPHSVDGAGADARFALPTALAFDDAGNLYVTDAGDHIIRRITDAGVVSTIAGVAGKPGHIDGPGATARFATPHGIAVDELGNLYVADGSNETIRRITPDGRVSIWAGIDGHAGAIDGSRLQASFDFPSSLAIFKSIVFVTARHAIRRIDAQGVVSTFAGYGGQGDARIGRGYRDGQGVAARFAEPNGIAIDMHGDIYVADTGNFVVRKVSSQGIVTTLAGSAGQRDIKDGSGPDARFRSPLSIAVANDGTIYVSDCGGALVRRISPEGFVSTPVHFRQGICGGGLAIDKAGAVYVSIGPRHTEGPWIGAIVKIAPNGMWSTFAGPALKEEELQPRAIGSRF